MKEGQELVSDPTLPFLFGDCGSDSAEFKGNGNGNGRASDARIGRQQGREERVLSLKSGQIVTTTVESHANLGDRALRWRW